MSSYRDTWVGGAGTQLWDLVCGIQSQLSCLFASDFIVAVTAKSAQGPWLNGHIRLSLCFTFFLSFPAFISLLKLPWLFLLIQYLACIKMFRGINRHGAAHTFASFWGPEPSAKGPGPSLSSCCGSHVPQNTICSINISGPISQHLAGYPAYSGLSINIC